MKLYAWLGQIFAQYACSCRPDPNVIKRNHAFLELVLGADDSIQNPASAKHWERARELLRLDTGSWGDQNHIWHHCGGIFCCPNGLKETKLKIWVAVLVPCLLLIHFF